MTLEKYASEDSLLGLKYIIFFKRYLSNPKVVFSNIKLWVTQSSKTELV